MSLTLRNLKGSPLTWTEGDDNLTYLEGLATGLSSSITGLSFSYILGVGNETNGNDIILSDGDVIDAANGGGQLDLRYGGVDDQVVVSNDGGAFAGESLYLSPAYIELSSYAAGGDIEIIAGNNNIICIDGQRTSMSDGFSANAQKIVIDNSGYIQIAGIYGATGSPSSIYIKDNSSTSSSSNAGADNPAIFIGTKNSTINSGVVNSVIVGGTGITASESNTVYVPDLVIQDNKTIKAASGGGQLDLRYGADNRVMLSTDAGAYAKEYLNMEPGYIELSAVDTGGSRIAMYADEYDAGLLVGSIGGTATSDFEAYGKNGFVLRNLTLGGSEELIIKHDDGININSLIVSLPTIPTYATNAAAITGGLVVNNVYKTATGEIRIVI